MCDGEEACVGGVGGREVEGEGGGRPFGEGAGGGC